MKPSQPFSGAEVSVDRLIALAGYAGLGEAASYAHSAVGGASGPKRGEGGDIYDLRPFEDGDDPRQIDPAASARSGRTQLRNRHEQVDRTALLVADFRASMLWGSRVRLRSVAAAEALALEGWRIVAGGGQVGAISYQNGSHESLAPQPREAAMLRISQMMASTHAEAMEVAERGGGGEAVTLSEMLGNAATLVKPGSDLIVATGMDDLGDDFAATVQSVGRKCRLVVLLVQDALEVEPPSGVFSARVGGVLSRGRLEPSSGMGYLEELGVEARLIRAIDDVETGLAS